MLLLSSLLAYPGTLLVSCLSQSSLLPSTALLLIGPLLAPPALALFPAKEHLLRNTAPSCPWAAAVRFWLALWPLDYKHGCLQHEGSSLLHASRLMAGKDKVHSRWQHASCALQYRSHGCPF